MLKLAKRKTDRHTHTHTHTDGPAREQFGHVGPAVSQPSMDLTDDVVLTQRPAALLHRRVQVVVPALAALLPSTSA